MNCPTAILQAAKHLNDDIKSNGFAAPQETNVHSVRSIYNEIITNPQLRKKTEKLYKDGHYAEAVEKAYKLIDNTVKARAGLKKEKITGAPLMNMVFSEHNPVLMLNEGASTSENDEQKGYMQIFAGCMTGVRNPRAHESDWTDTEERALQLLVFADHLLNRIELTEKKDT